MSVKSNVNFPRWTYHVKALFGLASKAKWPKEGLPAIEVDGWRVWVAPLIGEAIRTGGYYNRARRRSAHRAMAQCLACHQCMSAGRVHQHVCKAR
jgi:hypothetical protein